MSTERHPWPAWSLNNCLYFIIIAAKLANISRCKLKYIHTHIYTSKHPNVSACHCCVNGNGSLDLWLLNEFFGLLTTSTNFQLRCGLVLLSTRLSCFMAARIAPNVLFLIRYNITSIAEIITDFYMPTSFATITTRTYTQREIHTGTSIKLCTCALPTSRRAAVRPSVKS